MRKKVDSGQKRFKACSVDARRILDSYPDIGVYEVEMALNKAFSQNIKNLARRKNIEAAVAMSKSGYFKDIKERVPVDLGGSRVRRVYNLITNMYLDKDFQYEDFIAINDIAKYDSIAILKTIDEVKVKNLWYLRKVILANNNVSEYVRIDDIEIKDIKNKGNKISMDFINEYTK